MNLDFFRDLKNNISNDGVKDFVEELSIYLKNFKEKISEPNKELGFLEQLKNNSNISIVSENKILKEQNEILKDYANNTREKNTMYFVSNKSKVDDKYTIFKYDNNKESTIKLEQKELPLESGINCILREKNGKYVLDKEGTEYVKNEFIQMAKKVLEEQNTKLKDFRKEGHLYMVEEDRNGRVYLLDLNSKSNYVLEEVDFPKELISKATEGAVFKYEKGTYVFYSNDGFEMRYNS